MEREAREGLNMPPIQQNPGSDTILRMGYRMRRQAQFWQIKTGVNHTLREIEYWTYSLQLQGVDNPISPFLL